MTLPFGDSTATAAAAEPGPRASGAETGGARWRLLALLSLAVLLAMSPWFTASAGAEHFRDRWQLDAGRIGTLTTAVQIGFVAGTGLVAVLNLADLLPSRLLFAGCALAAAAANALLLAAIITRTTTR